MDSTAATFLWAAQVNLERAERAEQESDAMRAALRNLWMLACIDHAQDARWRIAIAEAEGFVEDEAYAGART